MTKVTFIEANGTSHSFDVTDGMSLMQAAVNHNVPGIDADCGGAVTCGTCVVCVPEMWKDKICARSDLERQMLEFSVGDSDSFRLSCQILVKPELDGLIVNIPDLHC